MTRTVRLDIAGASFEMPIGFAVSAKIAERVVDPLKLIIASAQSGQLELDTVQVVRILHIGAQGGGCQLTEEQFGDAVIGAGVMNYVPIAAQYISALVSGSPQLPVPQKGRAKKKPR